MKNIMQINPDNLFLRAAEFLNTWTITPIKTESKADYSSAESMVVLRKWMHAYLKGSGGYLTGKGRLVSNFLRDHLLGLGLSWVREGAILEQPGSGFNDSIFLSLLASSIHKCRDKVSLDSVSNYHELQAMGLIYYEGAFGIMQDVEAAYQCFHTAAKSKTGSSIFWLGMAHQYRIGVPVDLETAEQLYLQAAELQESSVYVHLGLLSETKQNLEAARRWYEKGAEAGDAKAILLLGSLYELGLGVKKDQAQAFQWYNLASKQGLPEGYTELGSLYRSGMGVRKDLDKTFEYWNLAAKEGDYLAHFFLAEDYLERDDIECNHVRAMEHLQWYLSQPAPSGSGDIKRVSWVQKTLEKLAQSASPEIQKYAKSILFSPNDACSLIRKERTEYVQQTNADALFKRAASCFAMWDASDIDSNDVLSIAILRDWIHDYLETQDGYLSSEFQLVDPRIQWRLMELGFALLKNSDPSECKMEEEQRDIFISTLNRGVQKYLKKTPLEEVQDVGELLVMSLCANYGMFGTTIDHALGLKILKKAVKSKNPTAHLWLGFMYQMGWGVMPDLNKARTNFASAETEDFTSEHSNLGLLYEKKKTPDGYADAKACYEKGIARGDAISMSWQGGMYEEGMGVEKDFDEALKWYKQAARQGLTQAYGQVGDIYRNRSFAGYSMALAAHYYHIAAARRDPYSQLQLGYIYQYGTGVKKDIALSVHYYIESIKFFQSGRQFSLLKERLEELYRVHSAECYYNEELANIIIFGGRATHHVLTEQRSIPFEIVDSHKIPNLIFHFYRTISKDNHMALKILTNQIQDGRWLCQINFASLRDDNKPYYIMALNTQWQHCYQNPLDVNSQHAEMLWKQAWTVLANYTSALIEAPNFEKSLFQKLIRDISSNFYELIDSSIINREEWIELYMTFERLKSCTPESYDALRQQIDNNLEQLKNRGVISEKNPDHCKKNEISGHVDEEKSDESSKNMSLWHKMQSNLFASFYKAMPVKPNDRQYIENKADEDQNAADGSSESMKLKN